MEEQNTVCTLDELAEFSLETKENEFSNGLAEVLNRFDSRYADLIISYSRDITSDKVDNPAVAEEQLTLCLNLYQSFGVALAILEGMHCQAISMAMESSEQKTVGGKEIEAKSLCAPLTTRKKYFEYALDTLKWKIPTLRDKVKTQVPG